MQEEIDFYDNYFAQNKEDLAQKILFKEEVNAMWFVLEELERENIELEYECFSVPENENTP